MLYTITYGSELLAIIITRHFAKPGVHFVTPFDFSQQLAYMNHPAGKTIQPHVHNQVEREVHYTQEVLFIKKGKLRVDFYSHCKTYLESCILEGGDAILLASGGHGFTVLDDVEFIEVKQGPYAAEKDKTKFDGISQEHVIIRELS